MNSEFGRCPQRDHTMRSYFAALEALAGKQGLTKDMMHKRFKEEMGFKHLKDLPLTKLKEIAFELQTIADGGPGL